MRTFQVITLTLPNLPEPSVAIAASRAGGLGVLDLEYTRDEGTALNAIQKLIKYSRGDVGLKLDSRATEFFAKITSDLPEKVKTVILTFSYQKRMQEQVEFLHRHGVKVLLEATCLEMAQFGEQLGVDGIIAKGNESGGRIEGETTFILLQRFLKHLTFRFARRQVLPIYAHGGIGLHTAAACYAAGAAGVVLDTQLALTKESALPESVKKRISLMDGSETICLGEKIGETYRICARPSTPAVEELKKIEKEQELCASSAKQITTDESSQADILNAWRQAVVQRIGWTSENQHILPVGQDIAFAMPLSKKFVTVGGIIQGIREAINSHVQTAVDLHPLSEGAPLAQSHKTRYPIVQGPMARISDVPSFALDVAEGGALPFLALAMMRGTQIKPLLEETRRLLGDRSWGVGIIGFVHPKLHAEQIEIIRHFKPPFVLIAGGRPDQGRVLEQEGIPTYFHVPSPGLLKMFIQNGVRRFVFEGRECGGHVGPRCSFVLWETMIDTLLESLPPNGDVSEYHVLFAGGIHDALSASMISAMAAPLAERGVRIGVQLGTAYLLTEEAVSSGAIVETFQQEAIKCDKTILLETALGHASRCVNTPYTEIFMQEKSRLESEGKSGEEIRDTLENMNLGRLRIASKGVGRNPQYGQKQGEPMLIPLSEEEQQASGMYMVGQIAALRDASCSIEELHHDIAVESLPRLERQFAERARPFVPQQKPSDIAIVGMSCIMPKAPDLQTYWENILNKVDAIIEVPKERWNWELYYDPDPRAKDKVYSKWGGFLDDVPFDPIQYGMPPNSLLSIEPLHLLTLEMVRAALKDAGYLQRPFPRERTSVILGAGGGAADLGQKYGIRSALPTFFGNTSPEIMSNFEDVLPEWTEDSFAGILMNVAAGRVANRFDLGGENYTVDAACASSLAAVHLAVKELEAGNSDMVIVGGADTMQGAFAYTCFSKTLALSPRGKCCTFGESADGIVLGEGIAMLVLKRLADAERDGDKIYAVIKSVGASSDGRDKSMTAPRPEGQALALRRAYQKANISPSTVGLIEAHGTGTVVGDQAEVQALCKVFNSEIRIPNSGFRWCAIGSVKSMIGHTKCAAGVASLIKATLALHHKVLPPTLNVDKPNSRANFEASPFYVNTETRPWILENEYPRRAGVSAFGFGGTNFHAVLEEYTGDYLGAADNDAALQEWPSELFLFGGNSRREILEAVDSVEKSLSRGAKPTLRDLSYTLNKLYEDIPFDKGGNKEGLQLALVATSLEDLHQKLIWAQKSLSSADKINDPRGIYYSEQPLAREGKVAFLFPGQGSQYINMLGDLSILFEEVRACFEGANRVLHQKLSQPLSTYIFPPPTFSEEEEQARREDLKQTNIAQPAIGAANMGMFHLLENLGVKPDFVAGHSYGEYVALCAAGVFSEEALIALSEARGRFIVESASPEPGAMAAVEAGAQIVTEVIGKIDNVGIANLNAPKQTVISGYHDSVEQAIERFNAKGIRARLIPVACAFHSPIVAAAKKRLADFLSHVDLSEPKIDVFSNTTAESYPKEPKAIAEQLAEHLVSPVVFITEIEALYKAGARIFVEVGPRNVLTGLTEQILSNRPALIVASDQKERSGILQLHHLLGRLASEGVPINPESLYSGRTVRQLNLNALEKETGQVELSSTTWLVNGSRAKPIRDAAKPDEVISPIRLVVADDVRQEGKARGQEDKRVEDASLRQIESEQKNVAVSDQLKIPIFSGRMAHSSKPKSQVTPKSSSDGSMQVMAQFQRMMNRFLDTQKNVMLTYLQMEHTDSTIGIPDVAQQEEKPLPLEQTSIMSLDRGEVAHETDAPHTTHHENDSLFTPDSAIIKSTSTPENKALMTQSEPVREVTDDERISLDEGIQTEILDEEKLTARLLQIVSERTGYPVEMLDLDLDLEADLGIDSIKRIEILGSFQEGYILPEQENVEVELEELAGRKTLRGIIDWIKGRMASIRVEHPDEDGGEPQAPKTDVSVGEISKPTVTHQSPITNHQSPVANSVTEVESIAAQPSDDGVVQRYTLTAVEAPLIDQYQRPKTLPTNRVLVVTDDEGGVAQTLAEDIRSKGNAIALVRMGEEVQEINQGHYTADITSPEEVTRLIDIIHQRQGPIGGLIHLLPLKAALPFEEMSLKDFRERLRLEIKSLFHLTKALGDELRQPSTEFDIIPNSEGGCLIAASAMGGTYSSAPIQIDTTDTESKPFFPGQASVSGFLKTISYEWPDVHIKVVDFDRNESVSTIADHLMREITTEDGRVEVGYSDSKRLVLQPMLSPVNKTGSASLEIDSDWVIMVTGGARGITADVALELAKNYQPTLLLIGRSPLPEPQESPETAGLNSPQELKSAIMTTIRREGQTVTPAQVEAVYNRLLKDREMRSNLAAMQNAGAKVHYYQADVRDEQIFGNVIDEIYQTYGRLDGVIHGAGTIEDKLVRDKTPESFDRVFDTKVESIFILSRKLRPESLKFLVIFSSVAGRFGNRGQSDYAAANEVYNKLAIYLDKHWPGRVVSVIWGPWARSGGMVSEALEKQFAQIGLELVPKSVGPRKLDEELRYGRKGEAEVILGGGGWENLKRKFPTLIQKQTPLVVSGAQPPNEHVSPSIREDGAFVIVKHLDPTQDLYLQHHQLDGKPVLPMAFTLELMAEIVSLCWPESELVEISDLRALGGIILNSGTKSIQVIAKPAGIRNSERLKVELSIESVAEKPKRTYYQATAELAKELSEEVSEQDEQLILKEKRPFPMDIEKAYKQWLFHGPILQRITKIDEIGDNGIIASLAASSPENCLAKASRGSWIIDPVVVDCGLQLTILWGRMYWDMTSLPGRFGTYKRFGEFNGENISCQVRIRPASKGNVIRADVAFIGENGRLLGLLEDLEHNCSKSLNRLTGE